MNNNLTTQIDFKSYGEWRCFLDELSDEDRHLLCNLLAEKFFEVKE